VIRPRTPALAFAESPPGRRVWALARPSNGHLGVFFCPDWINGSLIEAALQVKKSIFSAANW